MPWKIVERDDRFCVAKEDADGNAGEIEACHDTREEALSHMKALYANVEGAEEVPSTFVALADYANRMGSEPVQFLRTGTFTDANGNKVTITSDDLDKIVANFAQGVAGQDVPIDIQHERREAAGWVKSVWREGDRLIAQVDWTDFGAQLVADKVYKYLSATLDKARWVLKSISLVNFPAVKGLGPIELAEYVNDSVTDIETPRQEEPQEEPPSTSVAASHAMPKPLEVSMPDDVQAVPETAQPETPSMPTVLNENDIAQLRMRIEKEMKDTLLAEYARLEEAKAQMFADLMTQVREEREIVEFAESVTSSGAHALPVKADDLKVILNDLPKANRRKVMDMLRTIHTAGTVDFTEHGTTGGKAVKKNLPDDMAIALKGHLASGGSLDIFFEANRELGQVQEYDLAEYGGTNG